MFDPVSDWAPLRSERATAESVIEHYGQQTTDYEWLNSISHEFRLLFGQPGVSGFLVRNRSGQSVAGAVSAFLDVEFSRWVLQEADTWVKAQAAKVIEAGGTVTVPRPERALDAYLNATGNGLHLHFFALNWEGGFDDPVTYRLRDALSAEVLRCYAGAPIARITVEAWSEYISAGELAGFRMLRRYHGEWALLIADEASVSPGLMPFLKHPPQTLHLGHLYRCVLYYFTQGYTDPEIADAVGISQKSMKTYWSRILQACDGIVSFKSETGKRRDLLAYLRLHPEECWPLRP